MKKWFAVVATLILTGLTGLVSAAGDPAAGQQKAAACTACHGADGNSANGEWPKLAGQHPSYTVKQLQNFKAQLEPNPQVVRVNEIMKGMAAPLSEQDMEDLAAYFANQAISPGSADPELLETGQALYQGGNLNTGVPACTGCHGPTGRGNPAAGFPSLHAQHAQYTETQLKAFRSMQRANDPGKMMRNIASRMTDKEIQAVASYIQGLR
jgi:cytochrome c553